MTKKSVDLKHEFVWTLGDWSHDGHNVSSPHTIQSNYTAGEIRQAYNLLTKRLKWKFDREICSDYGDGALNEDVVDALKGFGVKFDFTENDDFSDRYDALSEDEFIKLFFAFIKLELPEINYKIVKDERTQLFGFWIGQNKFKEYEGGYANYSFGYGLMGSD